MPAHSPRPSVCSRRVVVAKSVSDSVHDSVIRFCAYNHSACKRYALIDNSAMRLAPSLCFRYLGIWRRTASRPSVCSRRVAVAKSAAYFHLLVRRPPASSRPPPTSFFSPTALLLLFVSGCAYRFLYCHNMRMFRVQGAQAASVINRIRFELYTERLRFHF